MIRTVFRGFTAAVLAVVMAAGSSAVAAAEEPTLQPELEAVHQAGMPGVQVAVRDGDEVWSGAAGVADIHSGRRLQPESEHRVGSITKTFVSAGLLQQVGQGRVDLDAPIGQYLPELVPGELGQQVTVRMLLNHTSGIGDYIAPAFPSLVHASLKSLEDNRFRTWQPEELIALGLQEPPTGAPGEKWSYSNTNYLIVGELLGKVTGQNPEQYVTEHVIEPLGLRHTYFPGEDLNLRGSHSQAYNALYNIPPQWGEYNVYNMTWAGTAGALVSTPEDINTFYRELLTGHVIGSAELDEMKQGVPAQGGATLYGLGLMILDGRECGWLYGHTGGTWGMDTVSMHSVDASHQVTYGLNLSKYQNLDENGVPQSHPIDTATVELAVDALCPNAPSAKSDLPKIPMLDQ